MFEYHGGMELRGGQPVGEVTPVDHALEQLATGLDHLVKVVEDGGLDHYDNLQLVGFLQSFERFRNRLALVDHRVVADGDRRGLPGVLTQPSMMRVLMHVLRLSPGEASRRCAAAAACGLRASLSGLSLPPVRPQLAAAQREGLVSPEQVDIIDRALKKVDRDGFDPGDIATGEASLTNFAATFGTKDLKMLADRVVDAINPDGTLPNDKLNYDRRHVALRRGRDGMYAGEFRLTGSLGAKLTAVLQPLSRPRVDTFPRSDSTPVQEVDERTFGQRTHDALEEVCDRLLQAGDVTGIGGTPATVIVTVGCEDLLDRLGYGTTSDGTLIPVPEVLKIANEAEIIPAVMNRAGAPLDLGRTRRIASGAQTHALIARDHGCSFPGCDRAPEWCERHHIIEWVDGGTTDLDNLTFLCRYHHHNFASRGWRCQINPDRLPEWIPPRWIDRNQQPLINSRILAHLKGTRQQRRERRTKRSAPATPTSPDPRTPGGANQPIGAEPTDPLLVKQVDEDGCGDLAKPQTVSKERDFGPRAVDPASVCRKGEGNR
jgi:Domain of unknown function (DUF222)/HNH endonuclease